MTPDAPTPQPDATLPNPTLPNPTLPNATLPNAPQPDRLQAGSEPGQPGSAEREARLKSAQTHDTELREALYTRKLLLALLSTLQHKGVLTPGETDTLLVAARRATDASFTPSVAVRSEFPAPEPLPTSGWVRRELKPPPVFDIQID